MIYRVVGQNPVFGHRRGETFDLVIPIAQERRLVAGGHIVRVPKPAKPGPAKAPSGARRSSNPPGGGEQ